MTAEVVYKGELRCELTHLFSGTHIFTDAPLDNQGKAASFSPTDLVATAAGACMMTVMGIKARDMQVDLTGTRIEVLKVMASNPRRIAEIHCTLHFPPGAWEEKTKTILEHTARHCPVLQSIHRDIKTEIIFNW